MCVVSLPAAPPGVAHNRHVIDAAIEAIRQASTEAQVVIDRAWRLSAEITVRAVPYECWKCGMNDFAVACMQEGEFAGPYDVVYTSNELPLAYARYLLIVAGHQQAHTIKFRRSKSLRESYLSNGCLRCDALGTLPVLATVIRPQAEWSLLCGLRVDSDFGEDRLAEADADSN